MISKLAKSTIIYAIGPQLPKLVSLFLLPILTEYLTPEDYAVNGIIAAYILLFDILKDLGVSIVVNNSFFKFPKRYLFIWKRLFGLLKIWSVFYGIILIPIIYLVAPKIVGDNIYKIITLIILPVMFFNVYSYFGRSYFQLNKKPLPFVIISVTSSIASIVVLFVSVVVFKQGYLSFFYATFVSSFISFLIYFYFLVIKFKIVPSFQFSYRWAKKKISISLTTLPHLYAGYVLSISDRIIMEWFDIPLKEIGMYIFAYSIGMYFSIIGKSLQQASGPYYMEFYSKENVENEKNAINMTIVMHLFILIVGFMIALWVKEIFQILSRNESLTNSYFIAIFIIMAYTYYPSYFLNSMKLWYLEKTKKLMKISVVAAIISIVLNIILIPLYGIFGAAIATFVSYMYFGFGGFFYKDIQEEFLVKNKLKYFLILNVVLTIILYNIRDIPIFYKGIISLSVVLLILIFFKRFKEKIQFHTK